MCHQRRHTNKIHKKQKKNKIKQNREVQKSTKCKRDDYAVKIMRLRKKIKIK